MKQIWICFLNSEILPYWLGYGGDLFNEPTCVHEGGCVKKGHEQCGFFELTRIS